MWSAILVKATACNLAIIVRRVKVYCAICKSTLFNKTGSSEITLLSNSGSIAKL